RSSPDPSSNGSTSGIGLPAHHVRAASPAWWSRGPSTLGTGVGRGTFGGRPDVMPPEGRAPASLSPCVPRPEGVDDDLVTPIALPRASHYGGVPAQEVRPLQPFPSSTSQALPGGSPTAALSPCSSR